MVRMREPQRFPLGTRVANPVEGRTGEIKAFDPDTGLYTLVYNDDHRDVLNASQTQQLVIRKSPEEEAKEAEERRKEKESDPNQYLGATVTKSSTSYEGKTLTSSGQVTQYFADIKRFRVLFSDGLYSDMTIDEVKQNLMLNDKKSDSERKRSGGHDAAESLSSKKKKKHHHHDEEKERPLNTQKFDSRKTAYTICREVLRIILSQKKVAKNCTEKQKVILNNKDLQPKKALVAFVDADGLQALEKMLTHWFRLDSTRSASLLVMKVLAMLPGVKEEHLRKTNIARTLRGIEKLSHSTGQIELVYGDLAQWIIKKWARTAMNRSFNRSARDLLLEQQAQISRAATDGQVHVASRSTAKLTPQQKETARLEALRAGTDKTDEAEQDPGEEVVVYLPQFNSLGSEDMRRPVRQTQVIESLAAKINRDYEDSLKRHKDGEDEEKNDGVTQGRMVFGKPQLMHFSQHVPVIDLFATTRSKIVGNNTATGGSTDNTVTSSAEVDDNSPPKPLPMPNKTTQPKKSILKIREEVITPASQVTW
ncbi:hypothetical protein L917_19163 [Phytophthora nicotianae]|uniref:Uncharacterized protein n=6 Tax=Phytophthora nicotianae TaxID=4792 RepID=V9E2U7_PHYNI|nr:hypothetical protein F443_19957 [Phytophthora nicotianae P1569]ETL80342.1 hypothetical protein L917_19163 [Phytophthora nicotianae]ETM33580.1 hypothetical protein L914_19206 [Phytophthora nicotianae]ETO62126.1 hypothetical protein F444_19949 [Phytophthora nicotianae P1976]